MKISLSKTIFKAGITVLVVMLTVMPIVSSHLIDFGNDSELSLTPTVNPIYIGEMYIDGDGNKENAIVVAASEQSIEIPVDPDGSDVELKVKYCMSCKGINDKGNVKFWIRGGDTKDASTLEFEEGYLFVTVLDCNRGDTIEWALTTTYYYFIGLLPIVDVDAGAGVCSQQQCYRGTSSLELLNTIISKHTTHQLPSNIMTISGTIICK